MIKEAISKVSEFNDLNSYETEMVFKQDVPLPCLILAVLLESEVEEKGWVR